MLSIAILFCVGFFASTQGTRDALSKLSKIEAEKPSQTVNICEGNWQYIKCPRGQAIFITRANYGRTSRDTCPHSAIRTTNCRSSRTLQAVKRLCHGQPMCKLYAINRVYGDPCVGTYKYLQVTYHCRRRYTSKRSIVCEGRTARMGCPLGLTLRIQAARYGRTNRIHCRHSAMGNTRCIAHRSRQIAQSRCNGRRFCRLPVTNRVFGDPCFGTYKYLDIMHQCV
ncbi:L-rhamnose-binding lectin CSL3-like [Rhopilema esculentum]|uniref:L-rhamnose-binding lectin CSL3-like n=1 Tax=Rhopilema esculentum TaxID=499914 RepID=UPI0031E068D2